MTLYTCQKVTIRKGNLIEVRRERKDASYKFQLYDTAAVEFIIRAGENAGAFVIESESKAIPELQLLYNSATGELFIQSHYSEEERVKIRQCFIRFLLNEPEITYKFIEM